MVCIYCGAGTSVTNSRPQKRSNQVWRRRRCEGCGAVLTSLEAYELASGIHVRSKGGKTSVFDRDRLFVSIYESLGHREAPVADATALTETIIAKLCSPTTAALLETTKIAAAAADTLRSFDHAAAVYYTAHHKDGHAL
jgi:transcriptional regulator NrdR family protein